MMTMVCVSCVDNEVVIYGVGLMVFDIDWPLVCRREHL